MSALGVGNGGNAFNVTPEGGVTCTGITSSGAIVGNLTGNVTGSVVGNVVGTVTGSAGALGAGAVFFSAELTGTGSAQDVAHGVGSVPRLAFVVPSDLTGGAFTVAYGTHTTTNVVVTVTSGEKFRVVAFKA